MPVHLSFSQFSSSSKTYGFSPDGQRLLVDLRNELGDDAFIEAIAPIDDQHIAAVFWSSGGRRDTTLWRVARGVAQREGPTARRIKVT